MKFDDLDARMRLFETAHDHSVLPGIHLVARIDGRGFTRLTKDTGDAFDVLKYIAGKRLARGLLTVIDATNVQPEARKPLVELAREHDVLPAAIVLKLPENVCHERNKSRPDRAFGPHVVRNQSMQLRRGLRGLEREGFRHVHVLETPEAVEQAELERQPLWNNRKWDKGPFDIIGDVHGCYDELVELLTKLGYAIATSPSPGTPGEVQCAFLVSCSTVRYFPSFGTVLKIN